MQHADKNGAEGFTLIEVVVALAIAGLGVALLVAATGSGIDNSSAGVRRVQAVGLAQSRMAQIGHTLPLKSGDYSGEEEGGLRWHVHVGPATAHGSVALYPVTVTEAWQSGRRQNTQSLYSERIGAP